MFPKIIVLTDCSASECSDIGLMSELCDVFLSLMCRTPHLPNRKITLMRRVFFEELDLMLGKSKSWFLEKGNKHNLYFF